MLVSLILILLFTTGGISLSYLFAEDEPLMWRIATGTVIGTVIFGLIIFITASFFGLYPLTIAAATLVTLLPSALFYQKNIRAQFQKDWRKAKGKLEGANFKKILRFGFYVFFFIMFWLFFERAMLETENGIFTGASQNYGDLPFHLGAIFSFSEGQNFPPENPSFAFAKFTYPFMADLVTASFVALGAKARDAMLVQNVLLAFSLLVILERFVFNLTKNRLAGKIAPVLLFFCGGLGFLWFFADLRQATQTFSEFFWKLPRDYTIGENFRWGNSMVVLFVTQRSLLLGMPLTLIVLQKLWQIFTSDKEEEKIIVSDTQIKKPFTIYHLPFSIFLVGLLAGTLPLIHVHSLIVLFVVTAFLFFLRLDKLRDWIAFGIGVCLIAVPQLFWVMSGSATQTSEFIGWHFGWDKRGDNFLWFWLKNLGLFIPLLILGTYMVFSKAKKESTEKQETNIRKSNPKTEIPNPKLNLYLILFYVPFTVLFLVSNVFKLAPWEWDNIKVLIYWFVGSLPFVSLVLARLWAEDKVLKTIAVGCLIVLTMAGALDVWRTITGSINFHVFSADSIKIAAQIRNRTAPNALFLNAPTFNSAVVLSGRRSLMRYSGHLSSYGIDYRDRETDVKKIYAGEAVADILLKKYGIEYVLISPEERANLTVNEEYFKKFPVFAQIGQHKIYQVKNP